METALKEKGLPEESDAAWIIDFLKHTGREDGPTSSI
jgi:hypothetical protein